MLHITSQAPSVTGWTFFSSLHVFLKFCQMNLDTFLFLTEIPRRGHCVTGRQLREHRSNVDESIERWLTRSEAGAQGREGSEAWETSSTPVSLDVHGLSFLSGCLLSLKGQTFTSSYGAVHLDVVLPLVTTCERSRAGSTCYVSPVTQPAPCRCDMGRPLLVLLPTRVKNMCYQIPGSLSRVCCLVLCGHILLQKGHCGLNGPMFGTRFF